MITSISNTDVSNVFTYNIPNLTILANNEAVVTKLYYITGLTTTNNMHEFIPKGVQLISYHPLHTALINILDHPAIILGIFIPLISYLVRGLNKSTDVLARIPELIHASILCNSKRIFSFSLVTTRRLNTRICSGLRKIKDKISSPNWRLNTLNVFRDQKKDYLNSVINNIDRNFFSYMMPTATQDIDYNEELRRDYQENLITYRHVHNNLLIQVRQLNMRYHSHIVNQGNPDSSDASTMTGVVTTMQGSQGLRNNVVSLTEELSLLRVQLDHLRERAIERNYNVDDQFGGHLTIALIPIIASHTQLWAFQRDSLDVLTENINVFFRVVGPLFYAPSPPLGSRPRTQDNEQDDNELDGSSKTRKI